MRLSRQYVVVKYLGCSEISPTIRYTGRDRIALTPNLSVQDDNVQYREINDTERNGSAKILFLGHDEGAL